MADIGSKLNNILKNRRGISLTELLVGVALLSAIIFGTTQMYITTMGDMQVIRSESFIGPLHLNMDSLFNSQQACANTMNQTVGALANGVVLPQIRDGSAPPGLLVNTFPMNDLNAGMVDILAPRVANLTTVGTDVTFNIAVTYRYNKGPGTRDITLNIPIVGVIDGTNRIVQCGSATAMLLDDTFILMVGNETKQGDLTVNGNISVGVNAGLGGNVTLDESFPAASAPNLRMNNLGTPSDIKLKKDVQELKLDQLELSSVHGYQYNLKKYKGQHTGFIAQELLRVLPAAGTLSEDGNSSINYISVIPAVWEYHKEVYNQRKMLLERLDHLERIGKQ